MKSIEEFRTTFHDPNTWITRSVGLFQSAEAVWLAGETSGYRPGSNVPPPASPLDELQCFGFYKVAMMLFGLALEAALKGILIANKSDKIRVALETDGGGDIQSVAIRTIGDSGNGHDLVALAKNAGVVSLNDSCDLNEKKHLRELSEYVSWRGRYPVPKSMSAEQEERERLNNAETIAFARSLLRQILKRPA